MIHRCCHLGVSFLFLCLGWDFIRAAENPIQNGGKISFEVAPAPSWVKPVKPAGDIPPGTENSGTVYLLVDRQENLERSAFYYHEVQKITSENGLRNAASISFSFDPAFEKLTLHSIQLIRDGTASNRLDRSRIRLSQSAKDPDRLVYDDSYSAGVALDDVRVGDEIEFAYTREGVNPLKRGKYSSTYLVQWSFPIVRNALRLTFPASRKIQFRAQNGAPQPTLQTAGGISEIVYEATNVPGRVLEDDVPEGYSARQRLELSEFQNWAEVVRWAMPLFETNDAPSPELTAEIDKLRATFDPEQQVVAALQFVQDEIRDVNFGAWIGGHSLTPPNEIMRRRSGDDKDKTMLLVALLRGCGIDAAPALASDFFRGTTPEQLPAPEVFDHVIVHVRLGQSVHWIDPWRASQRGPLSQIYVARYGYALVLRPGSESLTSFVAPRESWPVKKVVETYRVPAPDAAGELDVVSDYHGLAADQVRANFRESTREEIQKRYLDYYSRTFPEAKPRRLLWYEELPGEDRCRVSEWYAIPHIWQLSDDKSHYFATFNPGDISSALGSTTSPQRIDPLRMSYPSTVQEEMNIEMFEDWPLEVKANTTTTRFFRLRDEPSASGSHIQLDYTYEALADRVEPGELPTFVDAVSAVKDSLGYTLRYSAPEQLEKNRKPDTFNWAVAAAGLCFFGSATFFGLRYVRDSKLASPRLPPVECAARLNGIGGWLILLAIGQLLRPLGYLKTGYDLLPTLLRTESWRALTDPIESSFHPWWAPSLLFELFFNIACFVFSCVLIALFFKKRAAWPRCFVLFLIASLLGAALDIFLTHHIPAAAETLPSVVGTLGALAVAAGIWVPYVRYSKRVKATFRN